MSSCNASRTSPARRRNGQRKPCLAPENVSKPRGRPSGSVMARPKNRRANELLVSALACGATKESAAHQAGVSLSTVHRRLADPEFCRQLQAFRADIVQRTAGALTAAGLEFVKTLIALVDPGIPHATRLGASRA